MKQLAKRIEEIYPKLLLKCAEMELTGVMMNYKAGDIMLDIGDDVEGIPFLLEGVAVISVYDKLTEQYKSIYEVFPGELCSLVVMNCLTERPSEVRAKCARDIKTIIIPRNIVLRWLTTDPEIRKYLLDEFYTKYNELVRAL